MASAVPSAITVFWGSRRSEHAAGELRRQEDRDGHGEEGEPRRQGGVALDVLEELGHEVEQPVEAGVQQARAALAELRVRWVRSRSGQDRLLDPALLTEEEAEQDQSAASDRTVDGTAPSDRARLHQAEDDGRHPERAR